MPFSDLCSKLAAEWESTGHTEQSFQQVLQEYGAQEDPDSVERDVSILLVGTGFAGTAEDWYA